MPHPQRELAAYAATFDKLQEQQQALYQQHVREIRELQGRLRVAEERAGGLEAQRAEDVVRIESWGTMAEALEAGGDEQQRQVATMGRRYGRRWAWTTRTTKQTRMAIVDCAADGGSRKSYSEAELQSFVDDVFKKGEEKAANKDEQLSFNEFLRAGKADPQLGDFK